MNTIVDNILRAEKVNKNKPAMVLGDSAKSYHELVKLAEQVAATLQYNGINRGDRVALIMENCPDYAALYYGILMAGGVVVALNTTAKEEDFRNWISHAKASYILAKPSSLNIKVQDSNQYCLLRFGGLDFEFIDSVEEIEKSRLKYQYCHINSRDLASIIYTSGTTGEPKGVMLSHNNLASNVASICQYLPIESGDRVLNVLPFYYSYGNSVLHTNLGRGATIILENSMMFPIKVVESMQFYKTTAFYGVASTYAILLSRVKLEEYNLTSMRYITQAGGPMPPAHIEQIMKLLPSAKYFMMYGQTEATARLAYIPAELIHEKLGSAGKAIPGVDIHICDENGIELPIGSEGEICASGENIMMGYWNNPTLTNKVLKNGWLHTGDIAKLDRDGFIYITGRRSDMIKTGANRISPKEIEEKLAELDQIEESAAVGIPDEILGQVIKLYVVKKTGAEITKQNIMKFCKEKLANYKLPKEIEFVDSLPKTASGKLQRFKLNSILG